MGETGIEERLGLSAVYRRGITGKGVVAAVLDTGIYRHPDFGTPKSRILAFQDFVNWRAEAYDDNGHGTHVSGILASAGKCEDGSGIGVAPEAMLVSLKVLDRVGSGRIDAMLAALDWLLAHHRAYRIRIVNISVGMPLRRKKTGAGELLIRKVEELWDCGLIVVVAAGNEGPGDYTVTSPGVSRKVITVGALDEGRTPKIMRYSGCGPVPGTCVLKPDIVAPAKNILSCAVHGSGHIAQSGTSMAAPVVSGIAALMLSAEPWLTNLDVKIRLMETSTDCGLPKRRQGWGALNPQKIFFG